MPRTKYVVVFFGVLIAVLLLCAGYLALQGSQMTLKSTGNTALLIQSESLPTNVSVENDTTREEVRARLRAELEGYTAPAIATADATEKVAPELVDASHTTKAVAVKSVASLGCATPRATGLTSWGPLRIGLVEGVRRIESLESDVTGAPKHLVDLPPMPHLSGAEQCAQSDMFGIATDGRIIKTQTPLVSEATGVVGYALDGFGIFGTYENEKMVTHTDLDQCHGHVHTIVWDGVPVTMYHYHITSDAPYAPQCFRGIPVR